MTGMPLFLASCVELAGALGALVRYLLGRFIGERLGPQFPLGTLLIHVTGACMIGLLAGLFGRNLLSPITQTILASVFLGGYTTFSTMSWEGAQLARGESIRSSALYLGSNLALGLLAASLGLLLG